MTRSIDVANRIVRSNLKEKKRFFQLPPDLTDELVKYQIALDIPSFEETVELLVRQALAAVPEVAIVKHARLQALDEARRWVKERLASNMNEIQHQLMSGQ